METVIVKKNQAEQQRIAVLCVEIISGDSMKEGRKEGERERKGERQTDAPWRLIINEQ